MGIFASILILSAAYFVLVQIFARNEADTNHKLLLICVSGLALVDYAILTTLTDKIGILVFPILYTVHFFALYRFLYVPPKPAAIIVGIVWVGRVALAILGINT